MASESPPPARPDDRTQSAVLLFTDICDSTALKARYGAMEYKKVVERHNRLFEKLAAEEEITLIKNTGDGYFARSTSVAAVVRFALRFQHGMRVMAWPGFPITTRVGIHAGEVVDITTLGQADVLAPAADLAARVMGLAVGGQILLTRWPFDEARHFVRAHPAVEDCEPPALTWLAHGPYLFKGCEEPVEVFEVGATESAPMAAPPDGEKAKRTIRLGDEKTLGVRPANRIEVPWQTEGAGKKTEAGNRRVKGIMIGLGLVAVLAIVFAVFSRAFPGAKRGEETSRGLSSPTDQPSLLVAVVQPTPNPATTHAVTPVQAAPAIAAPASGALTLATQEKQSPQPVLSPSPPPQPVATPISPATPTPIATAPAIPAVATKEKPYINSLGMKFVPVPQTRVLMCVWKVRVKDFTAFADATGYDATTGVFSLRKGKWEAHGDSWRNPGFAQTGEHPVCAVNWFDAIAFCEWLTARERATGVIGKESYRLPTDKEWAAAAGTAEFPWGNRWPPTAEDANIAGREAKNEETGAQWEVLPTHTDLYPRTSPVGSFAANALGIFDLGGNLWEWCAEPFTGKADSRIIRGGSWFSFEKEYLRTQYRGDGRADSRGTVRGFRVVLALPAGGQ